MLMRSEPFTEVLVLRIPIAEKAKPRKVTVAGRQPATDQHAINA